MKTATTTAAQLEEAGRRLDASYHTSEGVRAHHFIREWAGQTTRPPDAEGVMKERAPVYGKHRLDTLAEVCLPNGIFIPSRFKRIFVDDPAHGAPYLTGGSILQAEPLTGAKRLSYRHTANMEELALHERMILITCSGTIGNCVYVNANFRGAVGSPDLIRIMANPKNILSGYLYAWLSSPLARALIQQKTYGAVVPHIEAHHVVDLPVLRLDAATEQQIHELTERAAKLRQTASALRQQAQAAASAAIGVNLDHFDKSNRNSIPMSSLRGRFEASFHAAQVTAEKLLGDCPFNRAFIGDLLQDMFYLGKLHRVFVSNAVEGIPLLSISDVQKAKLTSDKFVSRTLSRNVNQALLQKGWVLVSRVGTPGIVVYTRREMEGMAGTDHLVRLICDHHKILPGYLYSFLNSNVGQGLLIGSAHGSVQLVLPPEYIAQIKVPIPSRQSQELIHQSIEQSAEMLTQASETEDRAQTLLTQEFEARAVP